MKSTTPSKNGRISKRVRIALATAGIILLLTSMLLLLSLHGSSNRDTLRYDPPATLFAPPEDE